LQDIFISILDNNAIFRIIEEPEAHLFPIAQKQLIELFSLLINYNETNQIVITTHSPYILSVFNNLLFANRVNAKNQTITKEINTIIPSKYWIDSSDFAAYSLKSSLNESHYCISIVDHKTQLINQNYLDEVSEMLGGEFNALYSLHSKSFARR
jgi:predicted ATP-dependent endonuclease of OLD family